MTFIDDEQALKMWQAALERASAALRHPAEGGWEAAVKAFDCMELAGEWRQGTKHEFLTMAMNGATSVPANFVGKWTKWGRGRPRAYSSEEILARAPQRRPALCLSNSPGNPVIDRGDFMIIGGHSGGGKSTLAADLALVAAGHDLPRFPLKAFRPSGDDAGEAFGGDVIIVDSDERHGSIQRQVHRRLEALPDTGSSEGVVRVWSPGDRGNAVLFSTLGEKAAAEAVNGLHDLRSLARDGGQTAMIIVDSMSDAFMADFSSPQEVRLFYRDLKEMAAETGAVICICVGADFDAGDSPFDGRLFRGATNVWRSTRLALTMTKASHTDVTDCFNLGVFWSHGGARPRLQCRLKLLLSDGEEPGRIGFEMAGDWRTRDDTGQAG